MDRQQLDRADAEVLEVADHGVAAEAGVRAALVLGDLVVQLGVALDVQLVDDRVPPAGEQVVVALPVELVVDDDRAGHRGRGVDVAARGGVVRVEGQRRRAGDDIARDRAGVGVEQQLGGVEPAAVRGVPRAVGPEAVELADRHVGDLAVPDAQGAFGELVADLVAVVVEQAHPARGRLGGPDREVRGGRRPGRPELLVMSRPDRGDLVAVLPSPCVGAHPPHSVLAPPGWGKVPPSLGSAGAHWTRDYTSHIRRISHGRVLPPRGDATASAPSGSTGRR